MERLSDSLKFIRLTEGGRTPVRGASMRVWVQLQSAFASQLFLSVPSCLPACLPVCPSAYLSLPGSAGLPVSLFLCQSVSFHLSPPVSEFAAVPPTPQPTDDVDIYFETPADDKEHSRFQRAKEQLEIRHHNRMERVSAAGIRTGITSVVCDLWRR